jgi:hypothetical protein
MSEMHGAFSKHKRFDGPRFQKSSDHKDSSASLFVGGSLKFGSRRKLPREIEDFEQASFCSGVAE